MNSDLKYLQQILLEILVEIDKVCRAHDIPYSLYAGTALGAVRHKGFIPWDDDLDICMTRPNYNRFLEIWQAEKHSGYTLQNKELEPAFTQSFSKIRKDHTAFVQYEWEKGKYHTGIFVDIFPFDRIPNGRLKRCLFKWKCMQYQLFTREFVPPEAGIAVRLATTLLLHMVPEEKRPGKRQKLLQFITGFEGDTSCYRVGVETIAAVDHLAAPNLFEAYLELEFEGRRFMCVQHWDEWLRVIFGDYMQLPPVEQRTWSHHPIVLDFERSYEESKKSI